MKWLFAYVCHDISMSQLGFDSGVPCAFSGKAERLAFVLAPLFRFRLLASRSGTRCRHDCQCGLAWCLSMASRLVGGVAFVGSEAHAVDML